MADRSNLVPCRGTTGVTLSQPASRLCSNWARPSSSRPGGLYRLFAQDAVWRPAGPFAPQHGFGNAASSRPTRLRLAAQ